MLLVKKDRLNSFIVQKEKKVKTLPQELKSDYLHVPLYGALVLNSIIFLKF